MSRVGIIAGAINTYMAGVEGLPASPERVRELAEFIDGHLAPDCSPLEHPAVLTLRMVRASIDEALKPRLRRLPE